MTLKFGKRLEAIRNKPGGIAILDWIEDCDNALYSALTFQGPDGWRKQLAGDLKNSPEALDLIQQLPDDDLDLR